MNEYKLIVAGGRDFINIGMFVHELMQLCTTGDLKDENVSIVSGMARGADRMAYNFAMENNVKVYAKAADWDKYGKAAGFIRNKEMAQMADGCLAFWDGVSKGTENMIYTMRSMGKPVWVVMY